MLNRRALKRLLLTGKRLGEEQSNHILAVDAGMAEWLDHLTLVRNHLQTYQKVLREN